MTGQLREGGDGWEYQWQLGRRLCLEVIWLGVGEEGGVVVLKGFGLEVERSGRSDEQQIIMSISLWEGHYMEFIPFYCISW